jgi:hypothetical protein
MRWTPYLEECCKVLVAEEVLPENQILVHLIRLRQIMEKLNQSPWYDTLADATVAERPPAIFYINVLEAQLEEYKRSIPKELQQSPPLLLELYNVELTMYEIAFSKIPNVFGDSDFQRLEYLHCCLRKTKSWFDTFFAMPAADYVGFPLNVWAQLAHCTVCLYRLCNFEAPGWDLTQVRKICNTSRILEQTLDRLREAKDAAFVDEDATNPFDSFQFISTKISSIKTYWDAKIAVDAMAPVSTAVPEGTSDMDFLDEAWLQEFLGPWDECNDPQWAATYGQAAIGSGELHSQPPMNT